MNYVAMAMDTIDCRLRSLIKLQKYLGNCHRIAIGYNRAVTVYTFLGN